MIELEMLVFENKELVLLIVATIFAMTCAIDYDPDHPPVNIGRFVFPLPLLVVIGYLRTFEHDLVYKVLFWLIYAVIYISVMRYIFTREIKGKQVDIFQGLFFTTVFIVVFYRAIKALIELNT